MSTIERQFTNQAEMLNAVHQVFLEGLQAALEQQATATLLLSGGSTPVPLYRQLSSADLHWSRVHIALVDERWVATDSPASNERLLRENMLIDRAAAAKFTGMKNAHLSPFDGAAECNAHYANLPLPGTICLLGMGPDGHTASLFPQAEGLAAALAAERHCAAIRATRSAVTGEQLERMTMTPWSILQSRRLILMITGAAKWDIYRQARESAAAADLPVSLFIHQDMVPLEVYWAP